MNSPFPRSYRSNYRLLFGLSSTTQSLFQEITAPTIGYSFTCLPLRNPCSKKLPLQLSATLSLVFHYAIPDTHCQHGHASSRDQAQAKAAAGVINARHTVRRIVVYGAPSAVLVQAIEAALPQDLLSTSRHESGALLGEQIVVT